MRKGLYIVTFPSNLTVILTMNPTGMYTMLIKKLPHLLVTLLVGILIGCGSSNPLVDEASSNIEGQNYEAALESAEKSIEKYPGDPLGYYYKAVALGEIAGDLEEPVERQDYYKRMNEAFATAKSIADTTEKSPGEIDRIPAVKNVLWQTEHNRGVKLATDDSLKNAVSNPLQKSMEHLQNATIVQPDSSLSWNVLSQVAGMNKSYKEAAQAKTKYLEMIPDTTAEPSDFVQLASYYYNMDDQRKVLEVFQRAQKMFPENQDIVSNLADAYNRVGEPEEAISTIRKLVEQNPENPRFHLVLGTQIYQQALTYNDSLSANSDSLLQLQQQLRKASGSEAAEIKEKISQLEQENANLRPRVEELTTEAEEELKRTLELDSDNASAYNTLGIIYQNRAKAIFDQRNRTADNEKAKKLDDQGKERLRTAMKYYEKATEINPDNQSYWKSLFSIYTALGMDEKAKEAMKKAGMQ